MRMIKAVCLTLFSIYAAHAGESDILRDSHYGLLGIVPTASTQEIKRAYKKKALLWHPDKNPNDTEQALSSFKCLSQAYRNLSDAESRSAYDEQLADTLDQSMYADDLEMANKIRQRLNQHQVDSLLVTVYDFFDILREYCR